MDNNYNIRELKNENDSIPNIRTRKNFKENNELKYYSKNKNN
jgi:hypothetical protein